MLNWREVMSAVLQTGQITCHDARGLMIDCTGSGQDADCRSGVSWPVPRFEVLGDSVLDRLTRLVWTRNANMAEFPLAWQEALDYIATMNRDNVFGFPDWRLPNRRELRSLMSHQTRKPSLPEGLDTHYTEDVWDELNALAEAIGRAWQTPLSGVELLSDMRR